MVLLFTVVYRSNSYSTAKTPYNTGHHGWVLIAFPAVIAAFCVFMTQKTFPANAAFGIANPKSRLLD
jgi:formate hydrogenlyase subunit 4